MRLRQTSQERAAIARSARCPTRRPWRSHLLLDGQGPQSAGVVEKSTSKVALETWAWALWTTGDNQMRGALLLCATTGSEGRLRRDASMSSKGAVSRGGRGLLELAQSSSPAMSRALRWAPAATYDRRRRRASVRWPTAQDRRANGRGWRCSRGSRSRHPAGDPQDRRGHRGRVRRVRRDRPPARPVRPLACARAPCGAHRGSGRRDAAAARRAQAGSCGPAIA